MGPTILPAPALLGISHHHPYVAGTSLPSARQMKRSNYNIRDPFPTEIPARSLGSHAWHPMDPIRLGQSLRSNVCEAEAEARLKVMRFNARHRKVPPLGPTREVLPDPLRDARRDGTIVPLLPRSIRAPQW